MAKKKVSRAITPSKFEQCLKKKLLHFFPKKTKKNQEIVNREISSKTPLLQTSEKLTILPLLETSKIEEMSEKKIALRAPNALDLCALRACLHLQNLRNA